MSEQLKEPEDYISSIKYLSELIQQDLNFGRKETIPASARKILLDAIDLSKLYPIPEGEKAPIDPVVAKEHFVERGYSDSPPTEVGLYGLVCVEGGWVQSIVAITKNDYQMFVVHCADVGQNSLDHYHSNLTCPMWIKLA